jgi:hypothetical protein
MDTSIRLMKAHHQPKLTRILSSRLWRSSLILAFTSCYMMWAITFLAQLHPLIEPRRSDLRESFLHE